MGNIKNIIFDLGGVLLNIDYNKTISAFKDLGIKNFEQMFSQFHADAVFARLETGRISNDDFYAAIKRVVSGPVSSKEIDRAWNAMMLSYRPESLPELERLSQKYSLYLLSNTNSIHLDRFREIFTRDTGKPLLDVYFKKCWYSHLIGLRKPGKEVYEFVLQDAGLVAGETIFIDDTIDNIEGAKELGINTHLLLPHETIGNILI